MRDEKGRFINGYGFWTGKKRPGLKTSTTFSKGLIPWNKGKKKDRICAVCLNTFYRKNRKCCSKKCALVISAIETSIQLSGSDSPHWKGGISKINQRLRGTVEYDTWRKNVFKRDDYTCQLCGIRGSKIQADHYPYPFARYPQHRLDLDNGRTLCVDCHKSVTYKKFQFT